MRMNSYSGALVGFYLTKDDMESHQSLSKLDYLSKFSDHSYIMQPLSILCRSLQDIDTYTMGFPRGNSQGQTNSFRAVKHCLPGPCIRYGSYETTARYAWRSQVGVRIPDDAICQAILKKLDDPLICTSVRCPAKDQWMIDPVIIADTYEPESGFSVDGLLKSLGLEKYSITFLAEEVDMAALRHMTEDDLRTLGIPMGPRKKILLALDSKA